MNPQEKQDFEALRDQVDRLEQIVKRLEFNERLPIAAVRIPPHFHEKDQVSMKDIKGGFTILSATPTHAAEEGKCILYTNSTTTRVACKIDQEWKTVALT